MTGGESWLIVTVTYNSEEDLKKYWSWRRPPNLRWIVVDNASSDASVKTAESLGAEVLKLPCNVGFSAANNAGFRHGLDEAPSHVAFVNPDVDASMTSFKDLALRIHSLGGLVSPRLLNPDGTFQQNGRGTPSLINKLAHRLRGPSSTPWYAINPTSDYTLCTWLTGAFIACRVDDFKTLGGWDEKYFIYYEDSDIGMRAGRLGMSVAVDEAVHAVHGWARETTSIRWKPWRNEIKSAAKFYRRYPELLLTR